MSKFIPVEPDKWAELIASEARLKGRVIALEAELESEKAAYEALRSMSFTTAVPSEDYEKLNADNARLKAEVEAYKPASDEVAAAFLALPAPHNQVGRVVEGIESLQAEVERLRKATDLMSDAINIYRGWIRLPGDEPLREAFNRVIEAMKDGKPTGCIVNHNKVAQYLPKPPAAKEGKPSVEADTRTFEERVKTLTDASKGMWEGCPPSDEYIRQMRGNAKEGKPIYENKSTSFIEDLGNGVERHDLLFRYPVKEEMLTAQFGADAIDREYGMCCDFSSEVNRLKEEVKRLENENDNNSVMKEEWYHKCLSARAEVERLRKAGDSLVYSLQWCDWGSHVQTMDAVKRWNAAKEGKPSA